MSDRHHTNLDDLNSILEVPLLVCFDLRRGTAVAAVPAARAAAGAASRRAGCSYDAG